MKKIKTFAVPLIAAMITASCALSADRDTLSLRSCVLLALRNHPLVQTSAGAALSARGSYYSARSPFFPQLGAQAQASISDPKSQNPPYSAGLTLQQMIFDFGKTPARSAAAKKSWEASMADSQNALQSVILSAAIAYFNLGQAQAVERVSREAYTQAIEHLKQSEILFTAGRGIKYAVVKAQVDTATARLNVIRSANAVATSLVQLETMLGMKLSDSVALLDSLMPEAGTTPVDSALHVALANRPDLRAAQLRAASARAQVQAAKSTAFPSVNAAGTAGYRAQEPDGAWKRNLSGSVTATFPLFAGGAIQGSVLQSAGAYQTAQGNQKSVEQSILLDVKQQLALLDETQQRIDLAGRTVDQAALALSLARDRFAAGSGNALEVSDAEAGYENTKIAQIQARYDHAIAIARLQKALGLLDIPK